MKEFKPKLPSLGRWTFLFGCINIPVTLRWTFFKRCQNYLFIFTIKESLASVGLGQNYFQKIITSESCGTSLTPNTICIFFPSTPDHISRKESFVHQPGDGHVFHLGEHRVTIKVMKYVNDCGWLPSGDSENTGASFLPAAAQRPTVRSWLR